MPRPPSQVLERIMNCPSEPREARTVFWNQNYSFQRNFSYSWNVQMRDRKQEDPNWPLDYCGRMTKIKGSSHKVLLIEEMGPMMVFAGFNMFWVTGTMCPRLATMAAPTSALPMAMSPLLTVMTWAGREGPEDRALTEPTLQRRCDGAEPK